MPLGAAHPVPPPFESIIQKKKLFIILCDFEVWQMLKTHTHTHIHTHTHSHTHPPTHTHDHSHTHAHTHARSNPTLSQGFLSLRVDSYCERTNSDKTHGFHFIFQVEFRVKEIAEPRCLGLGVNPQEASRCEYFFAKLPTLRRPWASYNWQRP